MNPARPGPTPLVDGFEPASRADWTALAEAGLRGRTVDDLAMVTADGIRIAPVYGPEDGQPAGLPGAAPFTRGATAAGATPDGWDVRALVVDEGPEDANRTVLDELQRGSTSVLLDPQAIGIAGPADLAAVLNGVHLDMTTVALAPGPATNEVAGWLLDLWEASGVTEAERRGHLGLDPLGVAARYGGPPTVDAAALDLVARARPLPGVRALEVDATPYADAGTSDAGQLASALSTGVTYLRALVDHGIGLSDALATLSVTLPADADQFLTVARFRAFRRVWARMAEACGADPAEGAVYQHALTSAAMLSRRDPWVNMLRSTVAAFAAGIGGARSVTVRPFDSALGRPDEFGRRTARNLQLLLLEESRLSAVIDPAGGSWYVEDLTGRLAAATWERFRNLEAEGGMATALASGRATAEAEAGWARRYERLATRADPLTGVSEFPDLDEVAVRRPPGPPPAEGPLPLRRSASVFEALRDAADGAADQPTVRIIALGPLDGHAERVTFARNLFAVAGIRAVDGDLDSLDSDGPAVLCGSDDRYAAEAARAASSLKASGAGWVALVGEPGDDEAAWQAAGIDEFLHPGIDVVEVLGRALDWCGVER